jgi:hypothetical protein
MSAIRSASSGLIGLGLDNRHDAKSGIKSATLPHNLPCKHVPRHGCEVNRAKEEKAVASAVIVSCTRGCHSDCLTHIPIILLHHTYTYNALGQTLPYFHSDHHCTDSHKPHSFHTSNSIQLDSFNTTQIQTRHQHIILSDILRCHLHLSPSRNSIQRSTRYTAETRRFDLHPEHHPRQQLGRTPRLSAKLKQARLADLLSYPGLILMYQT